MGISFSLIQVVFSVICILFSITFTTHYFEGGSNWINIAVGLLGGGFLAGVLISIDSIFRRFNLRSFNTAILGLFFGYLMAQAILLSLSGIMGWEVHHSEWIPLRFVIHLVCAYLGMVMTIQASEEIRVSIPFIEFKQMSYKKKDIL